jgi:hypothetical protein
MYWSSDHYKGIDTTQIRCINIVHKRSTDQSLDLSFNRVNEIKISIMSTRVDPPSSHIVLSQMESISSKIIHIMSWAITQAIFDGIFVKGS